MIINGNYVFLDFEKYKPMFVDVFAKYYGEEFRDEIKAKFDRVNYRGYHNFRDVVDYYNDYISLYYDEIVEEFFKQANIPFSEGVKNKIFTQSSDIISNLINIASEGGEVILNTYTEQGKKSILDCREKLANLLNLDKNNLYNEIINLRKSLNKALDVIEKRYDCDVFRDVRSIRKNKQNIIKEYLLTLDDLGVSVDAVDVIKCSEENFDDISLYELNCFPLYFSDEFLEPGCVESFTVSEEDCESYKERFDLLVSRLTFLKFSGIELNFFDSLINLEFTEENLRNLELEYAYQKKHFVNLKNIHCEDIDMWKKEWKKGNFIPRYIADSIEYSRKEMQDKMYCKCKHFDFYKRNKFKIGQEYITTFNFDINDNYKPFFNVFIDENIANKEYILSSFIHELNHVLGFYPLSKDENQIYCKEGISLLAFEYLDKFDEEKKHWQDDDSRWSYLEDENLEILQENINERLALEIYQIFIDNYENPFVSDKEVVDDQSLYTSFDFITDEFYKAYRNLIKKNIVEKSNYNLYYDDRGYFEKKGPLGTLKRWIKNNVFVRQDEKRNKFSVKDLRKLGSIVGYFEKEVLHFISKHDLTKEQIESGEYRNILSSEESERLDYILYERDRLNEKLVENRKKIEKDTSILEK